MADEDKKTSETSNEQNITPGENEREVKPNTQKAFKTKTNASIKSKAKSELTFIIGFIFFIAFFVYTPPEIINPVIDKLKSQEYEYITTIILGISLNGIVSILISKIIGLFIFKQDSLAYGTSLDSKFFTHYYISSIAYNKYIIDEKEAIKKWFDYFNTWENPKHPQHNYYATTFDRSYSLRLFYNLKKILKWILIISILATLLCFLFKSHDSNKWIPVRVLVSILLFFSLTIINRSNTVEYDKTEINYEKKYKATGAYRKYLELELMNFHAFEKDVLLKEKYKTRSSANNGQKQEAKNNRDRKQK